MTAGPPTNSRANDRRREKASIEQHIRNSRHAVLVVNTRSARGARYYSEAKRRLVESGFKLDAAYPVRYAERLPEIVRQAIAQGHKFIIIGGGDGTISSVIDFFAYTNVLLGILPLGTANSFARTLAIPLDLAGAVCVLINGKVADIDLGRINDKCFANGASIGLPAAVGRATPHGLKRWLGRAGYLLVAIHRFFRHKPFRCTVTKEGENLCFDALDVRIANGGYQGGILVASEATVDSGEIVVYILKGKSKWGLLKEWGRVALGARSSLDNVEVLKASHLVIDAVPEQNVVIDGEIVTQTPIRVSIARKALFLMAPRSFQDREDERP